MSGPASRGPGERRQGPRRQAPACVPVSRPRTRRGVHPRYRLPDYHPGHRRPGQVQGAWGPPVKHPHSTERSYRDAYRTGRMTAVERARVQQAGRASTGRRFPQANPGARPSPDQAQDPPRQEGDQKRSGAAARTSHTDKPHAPSGWSPGNVPGQRHRRREADPLNTESSDPARPGQGGKTVYRPDGVSTHDVGRVLAHLRPRKLDLRALPVIDQRDRGSRVDRAKGAAPRERNVPGDIRETART